MRAAALVLVLAAACGHGEPKRGIMNADSSQPVPADVEACLQTIDRDPDPGHGERTPSVACLIALGRPALWPTVPLLSADSSSTRARASRVIDQLTRREFGFDGTAWSDADRDRWSAWWAAIGYDYAAPADERARALERLQAALKAL
jgi:hypothetical protein